MGGRWSTARFPTKMDILSMQFDTPKDPNPRYLYVGTGDQVYLINLHTMEWSRIRGVGPDSAIHGMSVVAGFTWLPAGGSITQQVQAW